MRKIIVYLFLTLLIFLSSNENYVIAKSNPPSSCGGYGEAPCGGSSCTSGLVIKNGRCFPPDYNPDNTRSGGNGLLFCDGGNGIDTAIGCIPFNDISEFVGEVFRYLTGIFGAVALLMMAYGSFQITTSAGNQEKVKAGKELITSALSGLLFIIFSMFLLRLIGVEILKLPGLQ